jgi:hypothetical protein
MLAPIKWWHVSLLIQKNKEKKISSCGLHDLQLTIFCIKINLKIPMVGPKYKSFPKLFAYKTSFTKFIRLINEGNSFTIFLYANNFNLPKFTCPNLKFQSQDKSFKQVLRYLAKSVWIFNRNILLLVIGNFGYQILLVIS